MVELSYAKHYGLLYSVPIDTPFKLFPACLLPLAHSFLLFLCVSVGHNTRSWVPNFLQPVSTYWMQPARTCRLRFECGMIFATLCLKPERWMHVFKGPVNRWLLPWVVFSWVFHGAGACGVAKAIYKQLCFSPLGPVLIVLIIIIIRLFLFVSLPFDIIFIALIMYVLQSSLLNLFCYKKNIFFACVNGHVVKVLNYATYQ